MTDPASRSGAYVTCAVAGESYQAFVPSPLPPEPPLDSARFYDLLAKASQALGRLDTVTDILPDARLMLYFYVRKEAVLSSQIEGTQSSLSDLLLFEHEEVPGVPVHDVQEVSNYVAALEHGLKRLQEGFPLSLRLLRELHEILLSKGRGSHKQPGEFRRSQNWIGGTRPGNAHFVPPPPERLMECLDNFEKFLHAQSMPYPAIIKAALAHVQFETIHPFLDGNGRLGRLLITFLLCVEGVLKAPVLYLSLYFKNNRREYYDQLNRVRQTGDWETWIVFFLEGVVETATQAAETAQVADTLFAADRARINTLKRASESARRLHHYLCGKAMTTVPEAAKMLGITAPTARAALNHLVELEIIKEVSGRERRKLYVYQALIDVLEAGVR